MTVPVEGLGADDKRMKLRYAGVCRVCGTDLPARWKAFYERSTKPKHRGSRAPDVPRLETDEDFFEETRAAEHETLRYCERCNLP